MKAGTGLCLGVLTLGSLALVHCDRQAAPAAVQPPLPTVPATPLDPWTWHFVGGLLVIQGELNQPTQLTLKGSSLSETWLAPAGPVRWELYRPPAGEVAELRSGDGTLLAAWDFDSKPPAPQPRVPVAKTVQPPSSPVVHVEPPKPVPPPPVARVEPPKPLPPPVRIVPPGPWAKTEPHLPLPRTQPAAPPPVAKTVQPPPPPVVHVEPPKPVPPPPVAKVEPPKPLPPPVRIVPPGPWAKTEPHLPLPRTQPAAPPPVAKTVQPPPPPVVHVEPPKPVSPPPVAKVEPPKPLPPPVRLEPHPLPPVAKVETSSPAAVSDSVKDWPGAGEGLNLLRGPKGDRRICMTFDGGSTAEVAVDILDVLHEHGIRTTLFLTGEFIRKYPDIVRRMAAEGHELGNHTLTHPHLAPRMKRDPQWTRERFQKELLDADRALYQLLGRPMDPYWRAPFGEHTAELRRWAEELGYRHVSWSEGADTLDWATVKERRIYHTGNAILDRLEKRMGKSDGDGLIVLMHLGSLRPAVDRPAKYLGPFIDRALQDGWHFVAIGDYLKAMGRQRWEPSRRVARINQGN